MTKPNAGFTLIETSLVMAVLGLLFVIVFIGSTELQDRARFNSSIDQEIEEFNFARNYSTSGVNEVGPGNTTSGVIAGTGVELDNDHLPNFPLGELETLYANPDSNGYPDMSTIDNVWPINAAVSSCPPADHPSDRECREIFFNVPDSSINLVSAANTDGSVTNSAPDHAVVYYAQTSHGLQVCEDINPKYESVSGACSNAFTAPLDLQLGDKDNPSLKATIEVDNKSGLARRLN